MPLFLVALTFGSGSKSGPAYSMTQSSMKTETAEVTSVLPPEFSCTAERDSDPATGSDEKNDPNRLDAPSARNSWPGWILEDDKASLGLA